MEQERDYEAQVQQKDVENSEGAGGKRHEFPDHESFDAVRNDLGRKPTAEVEGDRNGLDMLLDVNLEMTVELGRAKLSIGDVMDLTQGSVIELNKMAGEPVDVRINGVLLAQGEVIVMDDIFGVRITRLNQRDDHSQILG